MKTSHLCLASLLCVAALAGCADEAVQPTTGAALVAITTNGNDIDADGYALVVDGRADWLVSSFDSMTVELATGIHTMGLSGLASNCLVAGQNPRSVSVGTGVLRVAFAVTCEAIFGSLRVITTTTGADLDPNGYSVDGPGGGGVPTNGSLVVSGITPAGYHVWLRDIAPNCAVRGPNPQFVRIVAGETAEISFVVECTPLTGILAVTVSTSGDAPDADGYVVGVDRACDFSDGYDCWYGWSAVVEANDTARFEVGVGPHAVTLDDIAPNCVTAPRSAAIQVAWGDTVTVAFEVACPAPSTVHSHGGHP